MVQKSETYFLGRLILLTIIASICCFAGIAFVPYSLTMMPDEAYADPAAVHSNSMSSPQCAVQETQYNSVLSRCSGVPIGADSSVSLLPIILSSKGADVSGVPISGSTGTEDKLKAEPGNTSALLRIINPSIKVSLCPCDVYTDPEHTQKVVDLEDTAAIFQLFGGNGPIDIIADHDGQAFAKLCETAPGATAEILNSSALPEYNPAISSGQSRQRSIHEFAAKVYCCIYCCEGINSGKTIFLDDGTDVTALPADTLVLYTCHGDWKHVTVTIWEEK